MISLEARKIAIAQALFDLENEFILKEIERILFHDEDSNDTWTPTEEEINGIKEALKQVENGEAISEESVRKRYKKWLK